MTVIGVTIPTTLCMHFTRPTRYTATSVDIDMCTFEATIWNGPGSSPGLSALLMELQKSKGADEKRIEEYAKLCKYDSIPWLRAYGRDTLAQSIQENVDARRRQRLRQLDTLGRILREAREISLEAK